jgi:hypothetical protein
MHHAEVAHHRETLFPQRYQQLPDSAMTVSIRGKQWLGRCCQFASGSAALKPGAHKVLIPERASAPHARGKLISLLLTSDS